MKKFLLIIVVLLQSCGFTPVYGEKYAEKFGGTLPHIDVQVSRGRNEQILKTALDDRFSPGGVPNTPADYALKFDTFTSIPIGAVIDGDATVQRYNVQVDVNFQLFRIADNKLVLKGKARRIGSYNATRQFFSDYVAQTDASDRAIKEMAADMSMRVQAFLIAPPKDYKLPPQPGEKKDDADKPAEVKPSTDWYRIKHENTY